MPLILRFLGLVSPLVTLDLMSDDQVTGYVAFLGEKTRFTLIHTFSVLHQRKNPSLKRFLGSGSLLTTLYLLLNHRAVVKQQI